MTIEQWLEDARMDAFRRQLPELATLLEGLATSTAALRAADWNDDASGKAQGDQGEESNLPDLPQLRGPKE